MHHRLDPMWTVNDLARKLTTWSMVCDKRLGRLLGYMHHNAEKNLLSHIGNRAKDIYLAFYVDASFTGNLVDSKSSSGSFLVFIGDRTWGCTP